MVGLRRGNQYFAKVFNKSLDVCRKLIFYKQSLHSAPQGLYSSPQGLNSSLQGLYSRLQGL